MTIYLIARSGNKSTDVSLLAQSDLVIQINKDNTYNTIYKVLKNRNPDTDETSLHGFFNILTTIIRKGIETETRISREKFLT